MVFIKSINCVVFVWIYIEIKEIYKIIEATFLTLHFFRRSKGGTSPLVAVNMFLVSGDMYPSTLYVSGYKLLVRDTCFRATCVLV